jgi:aminopeptidase N
MQNTETAAMAAQSSNNQTVFLKDYMLPPCSIKHTNLTFYLNADKTIIESVLHIHKQNVSVLTLRLDGQNIELIEIKDEQVDADGINIDIQNYGLEFKLKLSNALNPSQNTELMGLYLSNQRFFTQCEPQGFRRITYYIDRPDVMSIYTVTIHAVKADYPVLLSNGNLIEQQTYSKNDVEMHYAIWEDPFPKPSYLFALVAGNLVCNERVVDFQNGPKTLQIWVEPKDLHKTDHALNSLVKSIMWDERVYKRQLDLDQFMIVAVSDFNMGAMENKGLNIFNAKYVLATPETATDKDYFNIESIVAHEYFHNWTGNRVTCRDWFQLSLKEGLTVFRDQCFSQDSIRFAQQQALQKKANKNKQHHDYEEEEDISSIDQDLQDIVFFDEAENTPSSENIENVESVLAITPAFIDIQRIQQVSYLRQKQFIEDASAHKHAVQPQLYQEINNFYTSTVYQKGAEVVRLYQTILGEEGFQAGMQLYFDRHDGQAVTCQDFLQAMADANKVDLKQMNLWYTQLGTPHVYVEDIYDEQAQTYSITFTQNTLAAPNNQAFYIPISMGLLHRDENLEGTSLNMLLKLQNNSSIHYRLNEANNSIVLFLSENQHTVVFEDVASKPIPSLLRQFSAPVIVHYNYTLKELLHILRHDNDSFNRWQACQSAWLMCLEPIIDYFSQQFDEMTIDNRPIKINSQQALNIPLALQEDIARLLQIINGMVVSFYKNNMTHAKYYRLEYADFLALLSAIPSADMIAEYMLKQNKTLNPHAISAAIQTAEILYAFKYPKTWFKVYAAIDKIEQSEYRYEDYPWRNLQNIALYYISIFEATYSKTAVQHYLKSKNLTGLQSAIRAMIATKHLRLKDYIQDFYYKYQNDEQCLDKWFSLKTIALNNSDEPFKVLRDLLQHEKFSLSNPNRAMSVLSVFFNQQILFHTEIGYGIWVDAILHLDKINPYIASACAKTFNNMQAYATEYQQAMRSAIDKLKQHELSKSVHEIVMKLG